MELRRVDPRTLKKNPGNPRKIQPGEMSDAALAANIKAVGILQPPTVTEKNGELTIAYGARRVRIAIEIGLPEIDVLVKDPDDHDQMRAVSENVVRAPMATVDLWRSIESLASENWTEEAIASALAIPVRQIRKLRLLATVHPAILDQIGAGDMPKEQELRTIASAPREDQAAVWKKLKPKKGEGAIWWQIAQALEKTRFFAKDAKFGEAEREAFGIVWQEDLFAEGDEDNRFTVDGEAFASAQRAWLDAHMPKNGVWIEIDEYGSEKLPPKAKRTWTKPKKGDQIGFAIHPRDGTIHEVVFRIPEPETKKGKRPLEPRTSDEAPAPKKTRPEITYKGTEIIGALRTEALVKSLEANPIDDMTLIGLLILALNARNVSVQTHGGSGTPPGQSSFSRSPRAAGSATTPNACASSRARRSPMSSPARSGIAIAGFPLASRATRIGADAHLGNMATEDFLSCLSKAGHRASRIEPERPAAPARQGHPRRSRHGSLRLDLRPPGSPVRPDPSRNRPPLGSSARLLVELRGPDDGSDETFEGADGAPGAEEDPIEPEPDADLDSEDSDENAHLDDENPPIVQTRTRAPRRHAATSD